MWIATGADDVNSARREGASILYSSAARDSAPVKAQAVVRGGTVAGFFGWIFSWDQWSESVVSLASMHQLQSTYRQEEEPFRHGTSTNARRRL